MPRLIFFVFVCDKREMMAYHARRRLSVGAVQGLCRHATPDIF